MFSLEIIISNYYSILKSKKLFFYFLENLFEISVQIVFFLPPLLPTSFLPGTLGLLKSFKLNCWIEFKEKIKDFKNLRVANSELIIWIACLVSLIWVKSLSHLLKCIGIWWIYTLWILWLNTRILLTLLELLGINGRTSRRRRTSAHLCCFFYTNENFLFISIKT